ncbi:histidine-containing phosphotransfer protein 2-like [Andrographis paniculata]|uniref:histidine-containing phosphotransfer protein 2-like n=1 Tax=Andrographis paniculata TaxID=175694 RepID=UPI0021E877EC|nr:histidine-containing phosphotransfer protein 2-like [Andrographis paniculata]
MDYRMMDVESLKQLMLVRIGELEQKGLVDQHFRNCYSLKEGNGIKFFVELIPIFKDDVQKTINDMTDALNQPVMNFRQMYLDFIKLKGSSSCFGACRVREACATLYEAIENKSKERCIWALDGIKHEQKYLEDHLDIIVEIENEIIARSGGQRRQI